MGTTCILILIFVTTILDTILTVAGIKLGYIEEANPLLANAFHNNPEISAISIILLISLILHFLYKVQHTVKWMKTPLAIISLLKFAVLRAHMGWIYLIIKAAE